MKISIHRPVLIIHAEFLRRSEDVGYVICRSSPFSPLVISWDITARLKDTSIFTWYFTHVFIFVTLHIVLTVFMWNTQFCSEGIKMSSLFKSNGGEKTLKLASLWKIQKKTKNILLFLRSSSILPFSSLVWFILPPSLVIPSFSSWPRSGVRGRYAHAVCQWLQQSSGHPAAISVWGGAAQVQTHRAETHCKVTQPLPPPPQTPLQTGVEKLLYITPLFLLQTTSVSVLLQIPYNLLGLCRSSPLYPVTESHSLNFQLSWKMPFHTALHISKLIYDTFHSLVNWVHTTSIGYTNRGRVNGIFEMCAVAWENPSHAEIFLYV